MRTVNTKLPDGVWLPRARRRLYTATEAVGPYTQAGL